MTKCKTRLLVVHPVCIHEALATEYRPYNFNTKARVNTAPPRPPAHNADAVASLRATDVILVTRLGRVGLIIRKP